MSEVIVKPTINNSPRNLLIRDLHLTFARGDASTICDAFSENFIWQIVGRRKLGGIENREIKGNWIAKCKVSQLVINSIIENGQETFVSGSICFDNKSKFSFATIFTFKAWETKIESVSTFMLRHE